MRSHLDKGFLSAACAAILIMGQPSASSAIEPNTPEQAAAAVPVAVSQLPAPPANGELGFAFEDFSYAIYPGMAENCPTGWAHTNQEQFLASVSPAERARLLKPENEPELTKRWKAHTVFSDGRNVCTNYKEFPDRPGRSPVQGKVAFGLNLDGDEGNGSQNPWACTHQTFTGPSGERGIDNQLYRAEGCARQYRGPNGSFGEIVTDGRMKMATGAWTIVMILRGIDSLVRDDDVEVILASSGEQPIIDLKQNFIRNASFNLTPYPEWRNVFKGKIVDGVLSTNTLNLALRRGIAGGKNGEGTGFYLDRSQMRLVFRPDGSLEGTLGGYHRLSSLMGHSRAGTGTALVAGIDCAGEWNTLVKMADGDRDPATGQCRSISTAYNVIATPAYVFDRPPESPKTASAE